MISTLLFSLLGLVGLAGAAGSGSSSDSISPTPSAGNNPVARSNNVKPQKDMAEGQQPAAPIDETPVAEDTTPPVVEDNTPPAEEETPAEPAMNDAPVYSLSGSRDISGASDVVNIAGKDFAQLDSATIALSFNADSVAGTTGLLSRDASNFSGDGNHLSIMIDNGVLKARFQDGEDELILRTGGIEAGRDYQLALSFGNGEATLSLDAAIVDSGQTDISWASSPEYMQIGALGWSSGSGSGSFSNVFNGTIADVAIYDGAMSNDQLVALTNGGAMPEPTPVTEDNSPPVVEEEPTPVTEDNSPPVVEDEPTADQQPAAPVDEAPVVEEEPTPVAEDNSPPVVEDNTPPAEEETPAEPAMNDAPVYSLSGSQDISGASDVVNIAGKDFAQLDSATIALSFNADSVAGTTGLLSRDASNFSGDGNHLSIMIDNGVLKARFQDGEDELILRTGGIEAGRDYQLALSFGNGEATLSLDAAIVDSGQTDISWASSPEYMQIGALGWSSGSGSGSFSNVFNGTIADVAIYDGAMSNDQLVALTNGGAMPEPTPVTEDNSPPVVEEEPTPVTEDNSPPVVEDEPTADQQPAAPVDEAPVVEEEPTPVAEDNSPPVVEDEPTPEPTPVPYTGDGPESLGPTALSTSGALSIAGGRVTTLAPNTSGTVTKVEITDLPKYGNATVNPDNTIALVLSGSDYSGSLSLGYKVTYDDGTTASHTAKFNVAEPTQDAGWGAGNHYMLEEDANGDIVVETGDNHRPVYLSGSSDALSKADIAALEGLQVKDITTSWLINHPEYGGSEDMALDTAAGMDVWYGITGSGSEPGSHWLLFEKGYTYTDAGRIIDVGSNGEDGLHPLHVTSWGEGDRPVITSKIGIYGGVEAANIVFSDIEATGGVLNLDADNTLFSDVRFSESYGLNIQHVDGFTLHDSEVVNIVASAPSGDTWGTPRQQGLFAQDVSSILIEGSLFDHNGWEDDYREDLSTVGGMPPTQFSHNIYLQYNTTDVTFRDNITAQAAATGAQLRGGAYAEDNVFLDNNVAVNMLGGNYKDFGPVGNFTFFTDNLITSAGYKVAPSLGGKSMGLEDKGYDTTLLDNIIAHMADPDNPGELVEKTHAQTAFSSQNGLTYDDTIIYNWADGDLISNRSDTLDKNTGDVNPALADQTTIQNYAAALLGKPNATITDLMEYIKALPDSGLDDSVTADDIIAYFQNGFNVAPNGDEASTDHRFIPNDLADGIRWDNRINWNTEDVPDDGDNADLGGNWVNYGARTTAINNLDLGTGGKLAVTSGKLTVEGRTNAGDDGGTINVSNVGQIWMNGYDDNDQLSLNITGGRFANTGDMSGNTLTTISGGQAILATDGANYDVENGSELHVSGSGAKVGFDGNTGGTAVLRLADDGTLSFSADSGGIAGIEEFRSGALGDAPDVASGANLGLGTLKLDLSGLAGTTGSFRLISVDEMIGEFSGIEIIGLAGNRNAELVVDYETDALTLNVTGGGNGSVDLSQIGEETDMDHADSNAIWAALTEGQGTYSDDLPTDLEVNGNNVELDEMLV